jgi:transglutaminase-like putative cysteine protease
MKRATVVLCIALLTFTLPCASFGLSRRGIVTFKINLNAPEGAKTARLWFPYPLSGNYQTIDDVSLKGNYTSSAFYRDPASGAHYLFAEWQGGFEERVFEMVFSGEVEERSFTDLRDKGEPVPVEIVPYLDSTACVPTGGKVKEIADEIVKGKKGILEKARAVYDWTVENTYRNPNLRGCGLGIVERTLAEKGGKCADISTVFVALARAAGVPARDVFGLKLGKHTEDDITKGLHCWAEFYLPGTGWIPVDPADVRKLMLVNNLDLQGAREHREYFFGSVDQYHLVLEKDARGIVFSPPQEAPSLNYFLYPYAEVDGTPLDYFEPKEFGYSITFTAGTD